VREVVRQRRPRPIWVPPSPPGRPQAELRVFSAKVPRSR
jgi:hypothetical protein